MCYKISIFAFFLIIIVFDYFIAFAWNVKQNIVKKIVINSDFFESFIPYKTNFN